MLVVLLALLVSSGPAVAQERNERHPALGLNLTLPRSYSPMPVQPTEKLVQLRYLGKESARGLRPDLYVLRIGWGEDAAGASDRASQAENAAKDGEKPPIRSFAGDRKSVV